MKKVILGTVVLGLLSTTVYAKNIKQTICFSKSSCTEKYAYGSLGEDTNLCGGQCQGKTLPEMNKEGWKLIQVVSGLNQSFGMVFTKEK